MPIPSRLSRSRVGSSVVALALAAAVSVISAETASAERTTFVPTVEATRAGITPGEAYLGWRNHTSAPLTDAALVRLRSTQRSQSLSMTRAAASSTITGIDVSGWQRTVNWSYWRSHGRSFAYVKATEGVRFRNPYFGKQYSGAYRAGLIRGAYHFALPNRSSGASQASYFVAHGGGWSRDGRTLPGVVDMEYNPYGSTCFGLSRPGMVAWVKSFTRRYKALTGRDAVIYTTLDWWSRCTGNSTAFNRTNPLWVARYASKVGRLPGGWPFYTFWQQGTKPLDQDRFSSRRSRLVALAKG